MRSLPALTLSNTDGQHLSIFMMKIFLFFYLVVGSLGHKEGLSYAGIYKSISKGKPSGTKNIFGGQPILPVKGSENYRSTYRDYFDIDGGNPDIHGKIQRPCQVYDTFCIRKFFVDHSRCKISGKAVPEPVFRAQLTVNYPHTNMSATQLNVEYRGLNNARIEEFYINTVTDNLVITLFFPSTNIFANQTALKFYLRGREPIALRDFGTVNTINYSITTIIPDLKDLKLGEAEITSYFDTPVLPFVVGPGLATSADLEVETMLATFLATVPLDQLEAGLTDPNFYAANFIQYNICDFGLEVL